MLHTSILVVARIVHVATIVDRVCAGARSSGISIDTSAVVILRGAHASIRGAHARIRADPGYAGVCGTVSTTVSVVNSCCRAITTLRRGGGIAPPRCAPCS